MRRRSGIRFQCTEPGCRESGHFQPDTAADEARLRSLYENKWQCLRHGSPERVLSLTNKRRTTETIAGRSKRYPNLTGLFWADFSGFVSGPGFMAWADDFPEGTKLVIDARIVLPGDDQP